MIYQDQSDYESLRKVVENNEMIKRGLDKLGVAPKVPNTPDFGQDKQ